MTTTRPSSAPAPRGPGDRDTRSTEFSGNVAALADPAAALADRVVQAVVGAMEGAAIVLGTRLGWYGALSDAPATAPELAARTGTDARYAREWLEQQAVAGYLETDDADAAPDARRYTLPPEHAAVLAEPLSPMFSTPMAQAVMAFVGNLDRLVDVYRDGTGLGWAEMGQAARESQAAANRPFFVGALASEVLPSLPEIDAALRAGGRVADIGCGFGWSSIGIAAAYAEARVDGFDLDVPSVERARENAAEAGVADRVRFDATDVGTLDLAGSYDLVCAFECVHDLSDPVAVLAEMRRLVRPGGTVLVVDEKVAEQFAPPGDLVERLMYGYSLVCCLPDGLSRRPSAGTGTVMRPSVLEDYARRAGFDGVEVLPVEHDFFRFYRLRLQHPGLAERNVGG